MNQLTNPYRELNTAAKNVLSGLLTKMIAEDDIRVFKNMVAVYGVWQTELHNIEVAYSEWERRYE